MAGKGECARVVCGEVHEQTKRAVQANVIQTDSVKISRLIVVDRDIDMVTPMLTQVRRRYVKYLMC